MSKFVEIQFSDLQLYELCGDGSFGSVYRGLWKSENKEVAVKKLHYLQNEAEHLSMLRHRNIIIFYGAVLQPGNFCIVTEYASKGSLHAYLRIPNISLELDHILSWAEDIAQGIDYLHTGAPVALVHRDLKSRNVVIDQNYTCKICDFGSSRTFINTTKMSVVGTYPWMAPEMILSQPVSEACDAWSYGVVLWELLTCEEPFRGLQGIQVAWQVIEKGVRLTIPESCPPTFTRLMKWCWQMAPADRPSFKDILTALTGMASDDSLKDEANTFLGNKSVWRDEIDSALDKLKKTKHELHAKERELAERERRLLQREQVSTRSQAENDDVNLWSVEDVFAWVQNLLSDNGDLGQYAQLFRDNHINGLHLLSLSMDDLVQMGITSFGHRLELHLFIRFLASENDRMMNFPPLNLPTPERKPARRERLSLTLTVLVGHLIMKKSAEPLDWKWKLYAEFDEEPAGFDASALIKSVEFGRHSSTSTTLSHKVTAPPYIMESWGIGIYDNMEVVSVINFNEEYVRSPRTHRYVHSIPVSGDLTPLQESIQVHLHPSIIFSTTEPVARKLPRSVSSPQLLQIWSSSRQSETLKSNQSSYATIVANSNGLTVEEEEPVYVSVTSKLMTPRVKIPNAKKHSFHQQTSSSSSSKTPGTSASSASPGSRRGSVTSAQRISPFSPHGRPRFPADATSTHSSAHQPDSRRYSNENQLSVSFQIGSGQRSPASSSDPVGSVSDSSSSFEIASLVSNLSGLENKLKNLTAKSSSPSVSVQNSRSQDASPSPARSDEGWSTVTRKVKKKPPLPKSGRGSATHRDTRPRGSARRGRRS